MKQTFNIPQGTEKVTIEQIGNQLIATFIPKEGEFKNGDFIYTPESDEWYECYLIIKDETEALCGWNKKHGIYTKNNCSNMFISLENSRPLTSSEKDFLLDKMHSAGYDWDAEKMELVNYRWKPQDGETYFLSSITQMELYDSISWCDDDVDNAWFELGLVFKTPEEAIELSKKMLNAIKK